MRSSLVAVAVAACGGAQHAHAPPALADLAWLEGTWHATELDSHWQNVAGALYGVAFDRDGFEVNIVDDTEVIFDTGRPGQ